MVVGAGVGTVVWMTSRRRKEKGGSGGDDKSLQDAAVADKSAFSGLGRRSQKGLETSGSGKHFHRVLRFQMILFFLFTVYSDLLLCPSTWDYFQNLKIFYFLTYF